MNNIDVSNIVDPNQNQPLFGKSLKFLQDASHDVMNGLALSLLENFGIPMASYSLTTVYVLSGCVRGGAADGGSGPVTVDQGYIFYDFEIYYLPAFSAADLGGQTLYSAINITNAAFDPSQFSNGVSFNVHKIRNWSVFGNFSGSNAQSSWVYLSDTWHYVGTAGEPAFQNSFANEGSGTTRLRFKKISGNQLVIGGFVFTPSNFTSEKIIFTLPVGHRPDNERIVSASGSQAGSLYGGCFVRFAANGDVSVQPYLGSPGMSNFFLTGLIIPLD